MCICLDLSLLNIECPKGCLIRWSEEYGNAC